MFKYPLGHVGFASVGLICGHDLLNLWSWHIMQMDIHLIEFAVFWGKFSTNISTSQNWGKNPGSLGDELDWRMDGETFLQGIIEIRRMLTSVFLSDQM